MACSTVLKKGKAGVDCGGSRPSLGLEQSIMLFNTEDIKTKDLDTTNKDIIDSFALTTGKIGLEVKGSKNLITTPYEFENPDNQLSGLKHVLEGLYFDPAIWEQRNMVDKLIAGAKIYAIIQQRVKSADAAQKYLFLGFDKGMELAEMTTPTPETNGYYSLTLKTPNNKLETQQPKVLKASEATKTSGSPATSQWARRFLGA